MHKQLLVINRECSSNKATNHLTDETRRAANRQPISLRFAIQLKVLHANVFMKATCQACCDTGCMGRLSEVHMNRIAKGVFEAPADASGCATHSTWNVDNEWLRCRHFDVFLLQLSLEFPMYSAL